MHGPRNPSRRSRNIGTAKQGHGADNRFVIPSSWHDDRVFYERLVDPIYVRRQVAGRSLLAVVEPPREDCFHACTVDDVVKLFGLLPADSWAHIGAVVLRQPKRKEEIARPAWGRLAYWTDLDVYDGPAIFLEAQRRKLQCRYSRSQSPFGLNELDELRREGHEVHRTARHFEVRSSAEACRTTQLYRTLAHEVGHYVHYEQALAVGIDHWSRPSLEKEQYAESFAREFRESRRASGHLPFERQLDAKSLASEGLDQEWFEG